METAIVNAFFDICLIVGGVSFIVALAAGLLSKLMNRESRYSDYVSAYGDYRDDPDFYRGDQ